MIETLYLWLQSTAAALFNHLYMAGYSLYQWLLDRGYDIALWVVSLFPLAADVPFSINFGILPPGTQALAWAIPVIGVLLDLSTLALVFSFAAYTELLILQISLARWLWGWIKW